MMFKVLVKLHPIIVMLLTTIQIQKQKLLKKKKVLKRRLLKKLIALKKQKVLKNKN